MNFKIGLRTIGLALASSIASAIYPSGPCMNEVWQSTENSGTELNCNANEVFTTVLGVDGPNSCMKGDIIVVNITTSIYFRASRYDFAIYTLTNTSGASDPIFGSECAIDVLGQTDADFAPDNIQNQDRDACFDVVANSGWTLEQFQFQDNLHVPCEGEPGTTTQTVHLQNCFSWRTNGKNEVCSEEHTPYPGSSSKCDCASMDLGILIHEESVPSTKPSLSPSETSYPSSVPTLAPSTSSYPSSLPSVLPSSSSSPSNKPSIVPTISTMPSSVPSLTPSTSSYPSSFPSLEPSASNQPTYQPSSSPSTSKQPSAEPTSSPSSSTSPSVHPTSAPSTSQQPTHQPSTSPSVSSYPSSAPTLAPSISSEPSSEPSLSPSVSSQPSAKPSSSPSISTAPSSEPSLSPTTSNMPSSMPSLSPSVSSQPSPAPSSSPSISAAPSSEPSLNPTLSKKPSSGPSSSPSISVQPSPKPSASPSDSTAPSSKPSMSPSLSKKPSSMPSSSPSVSSQPSSVPSSSPSISSAPNSEPSMNPTVSSQPSSTPSASPSISAAPSSEPSLNPTLSNKPSSTPSSSPSISAQPSVEPSLNPSTSTQPTAEPSLSPSESTAPSSHPSLTPSASPSSDPTSVSGVGGTVWDDLNGDGLIDSGEVMLPNIEVNLLGEGGNIAMTTTSASDGSYFFSSVLPSTYSIKVVSGIEYTFSPVVNGGNQMIQSGSEHGISLPITLNGGEERDSMHAGLYKPITIGNKVWNDINGNGIQELGEQGVPGVEVALFGGNGAVVATTETDADGYYRFTGLPPGNYSVEFQLPSGYSFTQSAELLDDIQLDGLSLASADGSFLLADVTSDVNVDTGKTEQVDVISGDVNLSLDAGIYIPAKIIGFVWHDLNANGIQEEGEEGIEGAVVALFNEASVSFGVAVSDATGKYLFEGLQPGSYYGFFEAPTQDYFMSPAGQGSLDTDSDFDPDSKTTSLVALSSGDENTSAFDAGVFQLASVGNFVWFDSAADGIQGGDEIGFPFPLTINLYNMYNELQSSTISNETGAYLFEELVPGYYEIEFIMEEGDILSPPFQGNDEGLDSNVDPTTQRAQVTLVSGEHNFSIDAGIIADAPYYPDWAWDEQVCTNDGFDPEWMTSNNEGEQIYLYRNKEECCETHFWWRMVQCMANEEYKFYRNGEICDSKLEFEDWEMNSPADWTDTKLFDTLDECCANLFSYDYSGCMERSPVMFKFDFCFDVGSLLPPIDCQTADIYANVLEDAINIGLGEGSDANITRVGDASLTKVDGSTQCGGSLEGQDFVNDLTGTFVQPDLTDLPDSTTVCGVVTTESYDCTEDECLNDIYQSIIGNLSIYIDNGSLTANLNTLATTRLPPVEALQVVDGIAGSLSTYNLLLPSTISSQLGDLKYFKDIDSCGQKTAFASWEAKYDTLLDCCSANFNWQLDLCCEQGGGCGTNPNTSTTTSTIPATTTNNPVTTTTSSTVQSTTTTENPVTTTTTSTIQTTTDATMTTTTTSPPVLRFFADQSFGAEKLCDLKPLSEFESWEEPYNKLKDCCTNKWSWDYAKCCAGEGMGGCGDPPPTTVKYYPTWQYGKLCQSKTLFEGWEQTYDTLKDCCASTFGYAYEACCQSDGMGGCL